MSNIIDILLTEKLNSAEKIIVGLSGGADSIALTHILFSHFGAEKLLCAHVNHGIRGEEAQRDESFVVDFCREYGIELRVNSVDVPKLAAKLSMGTEECGRKVRYEFFESLITSETDVIATAHNADDNAETVLLNLARGTGLKGLSGIPKIRDNIIRPIMSMTRAQIEDYCKANSLYYIVDSSNLSEDYDRNKIRHSVLSSLKELNSKTVENITRTTELLAVDNEYLNLIAENELKNARNEYGLNAVKLKTLHEAILSRLLISYLSEFGFSRPEKKHIDAVIDAVFNNKSVTLPPSIQVDVRQTTLTVKHINFIENHRLPLEVGVETSFCGKNVLFLKESLKKDIKIHNLLFENAVDYDKIKSGLTLGCRENGDKIRLKNRNVTKSLKKLFNEMKIPAAMRADVMVIKDGDNVVFVYGVGVSEEYSVTESTQNVGYFKIT